MSPDDNTLAKALPVIRQADFDEAGYLRLHPDVALVIDRGLLASGWDHFERHGLSEGRRWVATKGATIMEPSGPKDPDAFPVPWSGVLREISPNDAMFVTSKQLYYQVGKSALLCIEAALHAAKQEKANIGNILDLPCGHGRVMRFIRAAFPRARITACDLDADGTRFCARTFQATAVISQVATEAIPLFEKYDLVWCGSLLTHLSSERCRAFLQLFHRVLHPHGILVFTAHGRSVEPRIAAGDKAYGLQAGQIKALLRDFRRNGFGYVDYPAHQGYGISLATPDFIKTNWLKDPDWQLLDYRERGWDDHQDAVCLRKPA